MRFVDFIISGVRYRTRKFLDPIIRYFYNRTLKRKVDILRKKPVIKVAFVVSELAVWKSESLYLEMLHNPRFNPILLLVPQPSVPEAVGDVMRYCEQKGYDFHLMNGKETIRSVCRPEIIIYPKPYDVSVSPRYGFRRNLYALFCYIAYGYHTVAEPEVNTSPLQEVVWQQYFENEAVMEYPRKIMKNHCRNGIITGLPMSDTLMLPQVSYPDPWKIVNHQPPTTNHQRSIPPLGASSGHRIIL